MEVDLRDVLESLVQNNATLPSTVSSLIQLSPLSWTKETRSFVLDYLASAFLDTVSPAVSCLADLENTSQPSVVSLIFQNSRFRPLLPDILFRILEKSDAEPEKVAFLCAFFVPLCKNLLFGAVTDFFAKKPSVFAPLGQCQKADLVVFETKNRILRILDAAKHLLLCPAVRKRLVDVWDVKPLFDFVKVLDSECDARVVIACGEVLSIRYNVPFKKIMGDKHSPLRTLQLVEEEALRKAALFSENPNPSAEITEFFDYYEIKDDTGNVSRSLTPVVDLTNENGAHGSKYQMCDATGNFVFVQNILLPKKKGEVDTDMEAEQTFVETPTAARNLHALALAVSLGSPVLLEGPTGSGKTAIVEYLAHLTGNAKSMVRVHLGDQTDAKTLLGSYVTTEKPSEFRWQMGILAQAVSKGLWILVEDIDIAPLDVVSVLIPLLETRKLFIPGRGEIIDAEPGFHIFATRTLTADGQKMVQGSHLLDSLWSRVVIEPLSSSELDLIISQRAPSVNLISDLFVRTYETLTECFKNKTSFLAQAVEPGKPRQKSDYIPLSALSRMPSSRDLIKWASRVNAIAQGNPIVTVKGAQIPAEALDVIFTEAMNCFCDSVSNTNAKMLLATEISKVWGIVPSKVEFLCKMRKPEIRRNEGSLSLSIGHVSLSIKKRAVDKMGGAVTAREAVTPFAHTGLSLRLLEKIALSVSRNEPVLLVGETGTGKTAVIQHLASSLGKTLVVQNMSQQTDSTDLLGGFKPVELRLICQPINTQFHTLFGKTFSRTQNASFLEKVQVAFAEQNWSKFVVLIRKALAMVEKKKDKMKEPMKKKWNELAAVISKFDVQQKEQKVKNSFAFSFVEGALVNAVRNGYWVLLDEINLANTETLEVLSGLLEGGSITLSETGALEPVPRHPDFRIFGCMNPPTDVGKKDLPPGLRNRFTEIYVEETFANDDLTMIITEYLHDIIARPPADKIVKFYLDAKEQCKTKLCDGANQKTHFSLRTLTRALQCTKKLTAHFGFPRALYEGFSMSFLTQLNHASMEIVQGLLKKYLAPSGMNEVQLKSAPNRPGPNYVLFGHYWIETGTVEPTVPQEFVFTESIKTYISAIARAVVSGGSPVLLQGPTSTGKTTMVEYLAKCTGHKFVRINNHEHTDIQEYLGSYVGDETGKLVFKEGAMVEAVRNGYWVLLDELNLAPSEVLEALNRLLDNNREVFIPETQETVKAHPHFMLFATQNPPGAYGGRKQMSRAFRNRFIEIHVDDFPDNELQTILVQRCIIPESYSRILVTIMKDLQKNRAVTQVFAGRSSFITLRDLFRWAQRQPNGHENLAAEGFALLVERLRRDEDKEVVRKIIDSHLKVVTDPVARIYRDPEFEPYMNALSEKASASTGIVWTKSMRRLFALVGRCLKNKEPVLLVGETGCGKTTVCQLWAEALKLQLKSINCHQHTETADFLGGLRPIRGKDAVALKLETKVRAYLEAARPDMKDSLSKIELSELLTLYQTFVESNVVVELENDKQEIEDLLKEYNALFAWVDGPLIDAMKNGDMFLIDEISLAEDAVLERLNSVLEPSRTLFLAEKGGAGDTEVIKAHENFRIVATMNPGGDFGKRELSPAMRNRFTEIWVNSLDPREDLMHIISARLCSPDLQFLVEPLLQFVEYIGTIHTGKAALSVRDILSWVQFIKTCVMEKNILPPWEAFVQGACMVFVDGLGVGSGLPDETVAAIKNKLLEKLLSFVDDDMIRSSLREMLFGLPTVQCLETGELQVGPFMTENGPNEFVTGDIANRIKSLKYDLSSPTTATNALRVIRAMQLKGRAILLEGSPGVGKTSLISALAQATGHNLTRINLSEQTDISDLMGADLPVEEENKDSGSGEVKGGEFSWRDGAFLAALKNGDWVLLDELNLASQSVLEGLNSVLDHRGECFIPELNRSFKCPTDFRIFAAQNPTKQGGGRKGLPKSFLNRFSQVYVERLTEADLLQVCVNLYPAVKKEWLAEMIRFNTAVVAKVTDPMQNFARKGSPWEFNLRDVFRWCDLMTSKPACAAESTVAHPLTYIDLVYFQRLRTKEDRDALFEMLSTFFVSEETKPPVEVAEFFRAKPAYFLNDDWIQIGFAVLRRNISIPNLSSSAFSANLDLLSSSLLPLQNVLKCVEMGWLTILIGGSASGKTSIIRAASQLTGNKLYEFSMNSSVDTSELLGGFEQIDATRHLKNFVAHLGELVDLCETQLVCALGTENTEILSGISHLNSTFLNELKAANTLSANAIAAANELIALIGKCIDAGKIAADSVPKYCTPAVLTDRLHTLPAMLEKSTAGCFEWTDSLLMRAIENGNWLLIDNVNFCNSTVLDRLNSLLEPNGILLVNERGLDENGNIRTVRPHKNFRLFFTMDPKNGEVSRAMRNRGIEICLLDDHIGKDDEFFMLNALGVMGEKLIKSMIAFHHESMEFFAGDAVPIRNAKNMLGLRDLLQWGRLSMDQIQRGVHPLTAFSSAMQQVYLRPFGVNPKTGKHPEIAAVFNDRFAKYFCFNEWLPESIRRDGNLTMDMMDSLHFPLRATSDSLRLDASAANIALSLALPLRYLARSSKGLWKRLSNTPAADKARWNTNDITNIIFEEAFQEAEYALNCFVADATPADCHVRIDVLKILLGGVKEVQTAYLLQKAIFSLSIVKTNKVFNGDFEQTFLANQPAMFSTDDAIVLLKNTVPVAVQNVENELLVLAKNQLYEELSERNALLAGEIATKNLNSLQKSILFYENRLFKESISFEFETYAFPLFASISAFFLAKLCSDNGFTDDDRRDFYQVLFVKRLLYKLLTQPQYNVFNVLSAFAVLTKLMPEERARSAETASFTVDSVFTTSDEIQQCMESDLLATTLRSLPELIKKCKDTVTRMLISPSTLWKHTHPRVIMPFVEKNVNSGMAEIFGRIQACSEALDKASRFAKLEKLSVMRKTLLEIAANFTRFVMESTGGAEFEEMKVSIADSLATLEAKIEEESVTRDSTARTSETLCAIQSKLYMQGDMYLNAQILLKSVSLAVATPAQADVIARDMFELVQGVVSNSASNTTRAITDFVPSLLLLWNVTDYANKNERTTKDVYALWRYLNEILFRFNKNAWSKPHTNISCLEELAFNNHSIVSVFETGPITLFKKSMSASMAQEVKKMERVSINDFQKRVNELRELDRTIVKRVESEGTESKSTIFSKLYLASLGEVMAASVKTAEQVQNAHACLDALVKCTDVFAENNLFADMFTAAVRVQDLDAFVAAQSSAYAERVVPATFDALLRGSINSFVRAAMWIYAKHVYETLAKDKVSMLDTVLFMNSSALEMLNSFADENLGKAYTLLGVYSMSQLLPIPKFDPTLKSKFRRNFFVQMKNTIEIQQRILGALQEVKMKDSAMSDFAIFLDSVLEKSRMNSKSSAEEVYSDRPADVYEELAQVISNARESCLNADRIIALSAYDKATELGHYLAQENLWQETSLGFLNIIAQEKFCPSFNDIVCPLSNAVFLAKYGLRLYSHSQMHMLLTPEIQLPTPVASSFSFVSVYDFVSKVMAFFTICPRFVNAQELCQFVQSVFAPEAEKYLKFVYENSFKGKKKFSAFYWDFSLSVLFQLTHIVCSKRLHGMPLCAADMNALNAVFTFMGKKWATIQELKEKKKIEEMSSFTQKLEVINPDDYLNDEAQKKYDEEEERKQLEALFPAFFDESVDTEVQIVQKRDDDFDDDDDDDEFDDKGHEDGFSEAPQKKRVKCSKTVAAAEPKEDIESELSTEKLGILCSIHAFIFDKDAPVNAMEMKGASGILFNTVSTLLNLLGLSGSDNIDKTQLLFHLGKFRETVNVANEAEVEREGQDIYELPNPVEARKIEEPLKAFQRLLKSEEFMLYADNAIIVAIGSKIDKILANLSYVSTPLYLFLTNAESLLGIVQKWRENAPQRLEMKAEYEALARLIVHWRKMQIEAFASVLLKKERMYAQSARKWWFNLCATLISDRKDTIFEDGNLVKVVNELLLTSNVGQFKTRLGLVKMFSEHITEMCKLGVLEQSAAEKTANAMRGVYRFFRQFMPNMDDYLAKQRAKTEKDLKNEIKLLNWQRIEYYSIKDNVSKSHKKLLLFAGRYDQLLRIPVTGRFDTVPIPPSLARFDVEKRNSSVILGVQSMYNGKDSVIFVDAADKKPQSSLPKMSRKFLSKTKDLFKRVLIQVEDNGECVVKYEDTIKDGLENMRTISAALLPFISDPADKNNKVLMFKMMREMFTDMGFKKKSSASSSRSDVSELLATGDIDIASLKTMKTWAADLADSDEKFVYYTGLLSRLLTESTRNHNEIPTHDFRDKDVLLSFAEQFTKISVLQKTSLSKAARALSSVVPFLDAIQKLDENRLAPHQGRFVAFAASVKAHCDSLLGGLDEFSSILTQFGITGTSFAPAFEHHSLVKVFTTEKDREDMLTAQDAVSGCLSAAVAKIEKSKSRNAFAVVSDFLSKCVNGLAAAKNSVVEDARRAEFGREMYAAINECVDGIVDSLLICSQNLFKFIPLDTEDSDKSFVAGCNDYIGCCDAISARYGMIASQMETLVEKVSAASERCSDEQLALLSKYLAFFAIFLKEHSDMCAWILGVSIRQHNITMQFAVKVMEVFVHMMEKGWNYAPKDEEEQNEEDQKDGKIEMADGTGMGEGEGEKDVSDQIEDENQLNTTEQNQTESRQESDKDKDKGFDMQNDFEGQMEDLPDEDDDQEKTKEQEEEEEREREEMDQDMGDLDDDKAEQVDRKFWDEEEEKDEKQKEEWEDGSAPMTRDDDEMMAKEDEEDEKEQKEKKDDQMIKEKPKPKKEEQEGEEDDEEEDAEMENEEGQFIEDEHQDPFNKKPEIEEEEVPEELPSDIELDGDDDEESEDGDEEEDEEGGENLDDLQDDDEPLSEEDPEECDEEPEASGPTDLPQPEEEEGENPPEVPPEEDPETMRKDETTEKKEHKEEDKVFGVTDDKTGTNSEQNEQNMAETPEQQKEKMENQSDANAANNDNSANADETEEQIVERKSSQPPEDQSSRPPRQEMRPNPEPFRKPSDAMKQWKKRLELIDFQLEDDGKEAETENKDEEMEDDEGEFAKTDMDDNREDTRVTAAPVNEMNEDMEMNIDEDMGEEEEEEQDEGEAKMDADVEMEDKDDEEQKPEEKPEEEKEKKRTMADSSAPAQPKKRQPEEDEEKKEEEKKPEGEEDDVDMEPEQNIVSTGDVTLENVRDAFTEMLDERADFEVAGEKSMDEGTAMKLWLKCQSSVSALSEELCEQLRIILEPTLTTQLKGDYKTGKRINMKKVIPYIASQFKKDKIWLRRTRPHKRNYQVLLAIDDSESMKNNHAGGLALSALALISQSLTRLEIGDIAVMRFGADASVVHPFSAQFAERDGANVVRNFSFSQKTTDIRLLSKTIVQFLDSSLAMQHAGGENALFQQIVFVISDGRISSREGVRQWINEAQTRKMFIVFIIIDNYKDPKESILQMQQVTFPNMKMTLVPYMETFPFPYYVVLHDITALPDTISSALRQWFEMIKDSQ